MTMKTSLLRTFRGMMARRPPRSALLDLAWMVLGLFFVLLDLFLDLWVTYSLLIERKYLLAQGYICLLIISSTTQQLFSFCWVLDDKKGGPVPWYILVIHLLHLGLIWRYVQYLKLRWTIGIEDTPTVATIFSPSINPKYQSSLEQADDIGLLRAFDTFLEHTPQLVLLLANSNCPIKLSYGFGLVMSFFSISWMLLNHKRTMCKSQGNESKFQSFGCCITYLLFNLLLVTPRVLSIALYVSSVKYYYIILHLVVELTVMLIICYFARTNFMTSSILEWIYRLVISVCLIYTWFNIVKGPTKRYRIIYHCFIIIDTSIMLVLAWWYWKQKPSSHIGFVVIASIVAASYMLGLVITCLYYKWMMCRLNRCEFDEVDGVPTTSLSTAAVHQPYRRLQMNTSNPTMREEFF